MKKIILLSIILIFLLGCTEMNETPDGTNTEIKNDSLDNNILQLENNNNDNTVNTNSNEINKTNHCDGSEIEFITPLKIGKLLANGGNFNSNDKLEFKNSYQFETNTIGELTIDSILFFDKKEKNKYLTLNEVNLTIVLTKLDENNNKTNESHKIKLLLKKSENYSQKNYFNLSEENYQIIENTEDNGLSFGNVKKGEKFILEVIWNNSKCEESKKTSESSIIRKCDIDELETVFNFYIGNPQFKSYGTTKTDEGFLITSKTIGSFEIDSIELRSENNEIYVIRDIVATIKLTKLDEHNEKTEDIRLVKLKIDKTSEPKKYFENKYYEIDGLREYNLISKEGITGNPFDAESATNFNLGIAKSSEKFLLEWDWEEYTCNIVNENTNLCNENSICEDKKEGNFRFFGGVCDRYTGKCYYNLIHP